VDWNLMEVRLRLYCNPTFRSKLGCPKDGNLTYADGHFPSLDKEGWREAPGWFDPVRNPPCPLCQRGEPAAGIFSPL